LSLNSHIEWTDATWNPVRGCTKISPGCKHCYAETFAERFRGVKGHPYEQGFDLKLIPAKLTEPLTWRSPKLVFVNSMSDLFRDGVPDDYIEAVCKVMVRAKWHTFQVLTKRSERLKGLLNGPLRFAAEQEHIWWGVSVEDRKYGLPRIGDLQKTPARVRELLQKAVRLDPHLAAGYLQLGIVYADQNNDAKAIMAYHRAIEADPRMDEPHYRLGQAYARVGQKEKARKELGVYQELSLKSAEEIERERSEIPQFVFELRDKR